jgi:beta-glucosidase
MRSILRNYTALLLAAFLAGSLEATGQDDFIWATASSAYQVEGGYKAGGKGLSNWDVYTNEYGITEARTGKRQTGNTSTNHANRRQYLQDFALMQELGVTAYRFSISWPRIFPTGTGTVNAAGIAYYDQLIDDLLAFGIEPMVTLYHWDMPWDLVQIGGWTNPESVSWFTEYANVVFRQFGGRVKHFITFNEPYINLFVLEPIIQNIMEGRPAVPTTEQLISQVPAAHHWLVASALATRMYRDMKLGGKIGITLSIGPTIPLDEDSQTDIDAARIQDGLHNRWYLNALYKGQYPEDIVSLFQEYFPALGFSASEMELLQRYPPDFLGVNFYAPNYVSAEPNMAFGLNARNNPDDDKMFNGPVRPEYLYRALLKLKEEYGNPEVIITENGAGFGPEDEQLVNGSVNDSLRTDYITRHIEQALRARDDGVNLSGYTLWSILDNFEWLSGFERRFGIVHVDFATQQRIPKASFYKYQEIIRESRQ